VGTGEPTREEVFAFIDAKPGRGAADAVAHFAAEGRNIDGAKVRQWLKRRRDAGGRDDAAVTPARGVTRGKQALKRPAGAKSAQTAASRTRATPVIDEAQLAPEMRAFLRGGVRRLGRIVAGNEVAEAPLEDDERKIERTISRDMRAVADAARALKTLLEIAPGIATFDVETSARDETGAPSDEDTARLDAAILQPDGRPALKLVTEEQA
jgi:hypothetical protein